MKKLFFTAIAVLAFSSAGFAGTKEVKSFSKFRCLEEVVKVISDWESENGCLSSSSYNAFYAYGVAHCGNRN